jgi:hypothetical protein
MDSLTKFAKLFLSWPVVLGALGIGIFLLLVTLLGAYFMTPAQPASAIPTAGLAIVPAPSATSILPTDTAVQYLTPTSDLPPSPLPNMIGIGSLVQIFRTEGTGLNIRTAPGLDSEVRFLAYDAEVFEVQDGPIEIDASHTIHPFLYCWWSPGHGVAHSC